MAEEESKVMTNKEFVMKDDLFKKCCDFAGLPATARQASKFRMRIGKAFGFKNQVVNEDI